MTVSHVGKNGQVDIGNSNMVGKRQDICSKLFVSGEFVNFRIMDARLDAVLLPEFHESHRIVQIRSILRKVRITKASWVSARPVGAYDWLEDRKEYCMRKPL